MRRKIYFSTLPNCSFKSCFADACLWIHVKWYFTWSSFW
jgi:hypothetical protein